MRRHVTPALVWLAALVALLPAGCTPVTGPLGAGAAPSTAPDTLTFHGDAARTGWYRAEMTLTSAAVGGGSFGEVWTSPRFDTVTLRGTTYEPHLYASPLYVNRVRITAGAHAGGPYGVVFAATSTGFVYAVEAFDRSGQYPRLAPGTILWSRDLGQPTPTLDGGVTVGVLGTPTIDARTRRLYVASDVTDAAGRRWEVFALDLGSGAILPGWPLAVDDAALAAINRNGPTRFQPAAAMSQRGGLNLSADGRFLHVPFGGYADGAAGWLVTVDTAAPALASAFAAAPTLDAAADGGMWGSGGVAVDAAGSIFETTGNSPAGSGSALGVWGNSLLEWTQSSPLRLGGTYTPWNYCQMDVNDTDLGGGSPVVFDLDPQTTSTPHLVAFGAKQGNAYLVDRANPRGRIDRRPPCATDPSAETSLREGAGTRPLNVFGPYSESSNNADLAKARTTPAYFRGPDGTSYVVFSGSTKRAVGDRTPVPPSVVRTRVVTRPGRPAYLTVDAQDTTLALRTPGSPVITSSAAGAVVWLVDANVFRSEPLRGTAVRHPVLYALDAMTMRLLWHSEPDQLDVGGKYSQPTIAGGVVFVGTDRIQAFGLLGSRSSEYHNAA